MRVGSIVGTVAFIIFSATPIVCAPVQSPVFYTNVLVKRTPDVAEVFAHSKSVDSMTGRASKLLNSMKATASGLLDSVTGKASKYFKQIHKGPARVAKTAPAAAKVEAKVFLENPRDLSKLPVQFSDDFSNAMKGAIKDGKLQPDQLPRDIYEARAKALYIARKVGVDPLAGETAITPKEQAGAKRLLGALAGKNDAQAATFAEKYFKVVLPKSKPLPHPPIKLRKELPKPPPQAA
ncbi:hypothetical protein FRB94_001069 [Tulasnella sp. JGI-2019a]|nr:hypothetical protein FRB94_001069 [Tulasnella sp. JGI-2019a]